jgi:hypothetical protein
MQPTQNARVTSAIAARSAYITAMTGPGPVSEIPNETTRFKIAIHNANVETDGFISALAQFITDQPWMTPDVRLVMSLGRGSGNGPALRARPACIIGRTYDKAAPGRCLACPSLTGERGHRAGERGPGNAHKNAYPSGASLKRHSTTPHTGRSGVAFSLSTAIDSSVGRLQSGGDSPIRVAAPARDRGASLVLVESREKGGSRCLLHLTQPG